jgi:hypothetical protein
MSNPIKLALQTVQSGVSQNDKHYKIGYAVAVAISWIGLALVLVGIIVAVTGFFGALAFNFRLYNIITSAVPGFTLSLIGIGAVLFGQLSRAIFDMSRKLQA